MSIIPKRITKNKKRVITKILKLDENNQYGDGMTKLLPTGCIKDSDDISRKTFKNLLESVSFENTIDHLYIVDVEFDFKNSTEREYAYNKIYPPIIEKQKTIDPCERSSFQLIEQFVMGENTKSLQIYSESSRQSFQKNFLPMYLEDLVLNELVGK